MIALTAVVIVAGLAAAAYAYAYNGNDTSAHAAPPAAHVGKFGRDGTLVPANAARATAPRKLDHAHPLRLWVGGDSLAGLFGPALGDDVGATGVARTVIDYKTSSGLSNDDIRNWYARAKEQMASSKPDAVVFIIGTNDTSIVNDVDANRDGVPDWEPAYRQQVARMMDLMIGPNHRTVFWLGPPTLGDDNLNRGAKAIGAIMHQEANKRAPDVVYLDTYKLFSGPDGGYSQQILDENGKEITARISDGTHFTPDGASYLARAVFTLIDARWKLMKQADPKQPIGWTSAPGSGEAVPGYSSQPTSRYQPYTQHSSSNSYRRHTSNGNAEAPTTYVPEASPTTFISPTTGAVAVPTTTPVVTTPKATSPPPPPPLPPTTGAATP